MKGAIYFSLAFLALVQAKRDLTNVFPLDINPIQLDVANFQSSPRIVGGQEAVPHSYPYQAALFLDIGKNRTAFCGGSIISDEFILTAAHCTWQASEVEVLLGAHEVNEIEPTQQRIVSKEFIIHKAWSPIFLTGDIALIKLPTKIQFTAEIQPIRLPRYSDLGKSLNRKLGQISGWGKDSDKSTTVSPVLRYVEAKVIRESLCKLYYFGMPGPNHVCTSGKGGKSACSGDSGGPLVTLEEDGQRTQQGLVSFGIAFGCEIGWPSVFTKVSSFLPWINKETGISIRD